MCKDVGGQINFFSAWSWDSARSGFDEHRSQINCSNGQLAHGLSTIGLNRLEFRSGILPCWSYMHGGVPAFHATNGMPTHMNLGGEARILTPEFDTWIQMGLKLVLAPQNPRTVDHVY